MLKEIKRLIFDRLYSNLSIAVKMKFLNAICSEYDLATVCDYTEKKYPLIAPNDGILKNLASTGEYYDQKVISWVSRQIAPDQHCIDVGANIGFWTIPLGQEKKKNKGVGKIFAFEPTPKTNTLLKANLRLNDLNQIVELREHALGEKEGLSQFTCFEGLHQSAGWNTFGSPSKLSADAAKFYRKIEIKIRCLDDVWIEQGRPKVGFIKIDVEGYEVMVLRGAKEFFREQITQESFFGYIEINAKALHACNSSLGDLWEAFDYCGLRPVAIDLTEGVAKFTWLTREDVLNTKSADVILYPAAKGR
jgi:FkbM family methyltransferase